MTDKPSPLNAERYLLSMMFTRQEDLAAAIDVYLEPRHFSDERTRAIYAAAVEEFTSSNTLEFSEFIQIHTKLGNIERMGGMQFLLQMTNEIPTSDRVEFWVKEIKDNYYRRELKKLGVGTAESTDDLTKTPHAIAAAMSNRALDIINEQDKPITLASAVDEAKAMVDRAMDGILEEGELGYPTPIDSVNRFLGMPRPGELITIAARPGVGKSSLLRGLTRHIAENIGRTLFCSREMPIQELVYVFAQEVSRVSWRMVRKGKVPLDKANDFKAGLDRIKGLGAHLSINDRDRTVDQLVARIAASARSDDKLRAVAVDYLQRYDPLQQKGETRDVAIGRFTMALKDAAIQHNIPVFLGAQIGRGSERENRQPRLSDLRESGNIEQDSDRVWFLWVPPETPQQMPQDPNDHTLPVLYVKLIQAKGRGDGLGSVDLAFHRPFTTFSEWNALTTQPKPLIS